MKPPNLQILGADGLHFRTQTSIPASTGVEEFLARAKPNSTRDLGTDTEGESSDISAGR